MRKLDDPQPAGTETLDQDMTPRDIADALARLRFYDRMQVIARPEIIWSTACAPA
jgi:hypothetical protein